MQPRESCRGQHETDGNLEARQLDKRLKKQAKTVSVREKTGMWGYKAQMSNLFQKESISGGHKEAGQGFLS